MLTTRNKATPLKIKRIERGIKAYDFAAALGISPSKLSLIENNLEKPAGWIKERAAEILNVPFDELWGKLSTTFKLEATK